MTSTNLRDAFRAFTTGCALITTQGADGPNVMAAEWTFNVSYDPFLILVAIDPENRTHDAVREAKEFGVNLVADDQIAAMGFAGHYSKADTDKLSSDLFATYAGKRIRAPMIRGALLNAECRLVDSYPMGDHTAFLGEVIEFSVAAEKSPLILHHGSHRLGERIVRDPQIVVAATPMSAKAGSEVAATGELTGPNRAGQSVRLALRDPSGDVIAEQDAVTGPEGDFRVTVGLPSSALEGSYLLEAESGSLRAQAHLAVSR